MSARTQARDWLRQRRARRHRHSGNDARPPHDLLDTFARNIDFTALDEQQFVHLLETLRILDTTGAGYELRGLSTDGIAEIVHCASKEKLRAIEEHGQLRAVFLDEIFRRMSERFRPDKAGNTDLVVSWRFTDGSGTDGYDRFQTVLKDGRCVSGADLRREPDTTLTLAVSDFVRIATGNANVASMFVTGKVRVKGEYAPAVRFSSYFDIPKPG